MANTRRRATSTAGGPDVAPSPRSRGGRQPRPRRPERPPSRAMRFFYGLSLFFGSLLTLVLLGAVAAAAYGAYLLRETSKDLPIQQAMLEYTPGGITTIYATDKDPKTGKPLVLGRVFSKYKEYAPIDEIPDVMKKATIAIEDERFLKHRGIDIEAIGRAVYRNFLNRDMGEGGSTLTQQLARNIYDQGSQAEAVAAGGGLHIGKEKTLRRKLQEAIMAILLEKNFSKEQILEMYLNEVCYGVNTYGVKAAAKMYFGRTPKQLSLSQAAILAGIPQQPARLELFNHMSAAKKRRDVVLAKMRELGYIKPEQEKVAASNGVKLVRTKADSSEPFKAPYFTNYVVRQLVKKYGKDVVYDGGLQVYTTLNYHMQQEAERALINGVNKARGAGVTEGALISVEPRTGYIRAMVGGKDFNGDQFNNTVQGGRQPGSSFKVIVYSAALSARPDRYSADANVDNSRISYGKYSPNGGGPGGWVPLRRAFASSYNNASVNTTNSIGVRRVIEYARRMGITSRMEPTLAIALGSYEVTPLEMASAYSIFPNHGNRAEPMSIIRVMDSEGVVLEANAPKVEVAVLPESTVSQLSDLMGDVVEYGTASRAEGIKEVPNAHGKTGTTNDNRDAWFVGYTPELSTAVWVCGVRRETRNGRIHVRYPPMSSGATGGGTCAPIWARFMKAAIPIQRKSKMPVLPPPEKVDRARNIMVDATPARRPAPDGYFDEQREPAPREQRPRRERRESPSVLAAASTPRPSLEPAADSQPALRPDLTAAAGDAGTSAAASAAVMPVVARPSEPSTVIAAVAPASTPRPRVEAPPPAPLMVVSICASSGQRAGLYCPETVTRSYTGGRGPRGRCRIHRGE